jgi:hypothetical protein
VRIAVDIDSTLHHYWDQLHSCVEETHREPHVLTAEPYPGAVEAIRAWHEAGHFILCEEEDILCAPDWPTLARRLERLLT